MTTRPKKLFKLASRRKRCLSDSSPSTEPKKIQIHLKTIRIRTVPNLNSPPVPALQFKKRNSSAVFSQEDSSDGSDGEAKPIGFLNYVCAFTDNLDEMFDDSVQSCDKLMLQFNLLKQMFPEFPTEMLKTLLVREDGNAQAVMKFLVDRDWTPHNISLSGSLSGSCSDHFDQLYYWGELDPSYLDLLKQTEPGTYFTVIQLPCVYVICYVDYRGEVIQRQTNSPIIRESHKRLFSLEHPLNRPSSISKFKLVPFLNSYNKVTISNVPLKLSRSK